jgi:hypothetical protein
MELYIKKLCRVFLSLSLLLAMNFYAQSQQLDSTLSNFSRNFQPEKAYIHYDKSSYLPGETIWYKVYLMEGLYPASESKNVYVDWISETGELLAHYANPVVDAISIGQFEIPDGYKGNTVHVRAYTRWMLNFDSSVIYKKQIRIHPKIAAAKQPMPDIIPTLTFFPEGGDMVAGIPNKVAFKATDQWGRPINVKGVVMEKTKIVDSLRTVHDGMGYFLFTPNAGETYTAKWKDDKGISRTSPLPIVKSEGISLQVSQAPDKRIIQVYVAPGTETSLKQYNIVGTLQGNMVFKTTGSAVAGGNFRKVVSTQNIPSGILTITVFDEGWNALAERISFINNNDYSFSSGFEVTRWGLNKRAKNEIEISLPDSLAGSFSVSVTDAAIDHDSSQNIISHFLLSSEIKGSVHDPHYYFTSNSEKLQQHLDLVMMTNGWRRFKWEDLTKGKLPVMKYSRDTAYLSLSGKIFGAQKSQLSGTESIVLLLKSKDSVFNTQILTINRDGSFGNPDLLFFDTLRVYYQIKSKLFGSSGATFMENKLAAPNYVQESKRFIKLLPFNYDTSSAYHLRLARESYRIQEMMKGNVMETVTVTAKAKTPLQEMDEKYASGLFQSGESYQFDLINDPLAMGRNDIFNYLQGKVAGLQILSGGMEGPQVTWRNSTPDFFLDERNVGIDLLQNVPIDDIAYIKVFRPPFIGASFGGAGGAIAVYTKKGSDQRRSSGGLSSNSITGYAPIKEFYSPNYNVIDKKHEAKDVRTTLYWNGMLSPGQSNKLKFSFFNNDVTKAFRVIVEGFTKEGMLMHLEQVME